MVWITVGWGKILITKLSDTWFYYLMEKEIDYMTYDSITKCKRPVTWHMIILPNARGRLHDAWCQLPNARGRLLDTWGDEQKQKASYMTHEANKITKEANYWTYGPITLCKRPITWRMAQLPNARGQLLDGSGRMAQLPNARGQWLDAWGQLLDSCGD